MDKLLDQMKNLKKVWGIDENTINKQVEEFKSHKNADEVEHTGNVWFGKELIPGDILTNQVIDMVSKGKNSFIPALTGFQGNRMGRSVSKPIVGEVDFPVILQERTSAALSHKQANRRLPTDKVTIVQKSLYAQVDISREELLYSVVELESLVKRKLADSFRKGIESAILNGDSNTAATGNVNSDDQALSVTSLDGASDHRLAYDGIRKVVLSGALNTDWIDIGIPSRQNLIQTRWLLGNYSFDLQDIILIMWGKTYNKYITINEFADASKNGKNSTITTGAIDSISGNDLFVSKYFPTTEADGKMSGVTPANNVKGGFIYMLRHAVQFGFGDPIDMESYKIVGQGISIVAAMDFGFTVVNKKAGETDPWVVMGINVTV